jgi:Terminase small subunit
MTKKKGTTPPPKSPPQINPRQELFCQEYSKDCNATQAALRAGYSTRTAQEQGSRLLTNVMIQSRVAELLEKKAIENKDYRQQILAEHQEILDFDLNEILVCNKYGAWDYKPLDQWSEHARKIVTFMGIGKNDRPIIKIDKHAAREAMAKTAGLYTDINVSLSNLRSYGIDLRLQDDGVWKLQTNEPNE